MENQRYLEADNASVSFTNSEELDSYLEFRRNNDKWIVIPMNEISAYGISNLPLFIGERCSSVVANIKGFKVEVPPIDPDNLENRECINTSGMFLIVPNSEGRGYIALPTDDRSLTSIYQRADDFSGVMIRSTPKNLKAVLPIEEKAQRVSRDFSLFEGDCKILFRDGKIRFMGSNQYTIVDNGVLIRFLEDELKKDHPHTSFKEGGVNHEFLSISFSLNDFLMEESLRLKMNDFGGNIHTITSGVTFVTSDIGMSAVKCNLFLMIDGVKVNLTGISINHKDAELEEEFCEKIRNYGEILKESEAIVEKLGNMEIDNVSHVVREITEYYSAIFPSKIAEEVITESVIKYLHGGTAMDCYLCLSDIIDRHFKQNEVSLSRKLDLSEQVAELIHLPFDKIASGEVKLKKKER